MFVLLSIRKLDESKSNSGGEENIFSGAIIVVSLVSDKAYKKTIALPGEYRPYDG
ncbi:hypothetical protein WJR50_28580 [Catalinimonas sp. 4WD22]|uniref:hypothetical protein n=1 Tax=Catalinimonas locisalis TaxID=3133978 RepID=UPI0031014D9D